MNEEIQGRSEEAAFPQLSQSLAPLTTDSTPGPSLPPSQHGSDSDADEHDDLGHKDDTAADEVSLH